MALFQRVIWYHLLVAREVRRMWLLFLIHVLIVAGICLPILILSGLKRGHVASLREALVRSPSGREVTIHSATDGPIMNDDLIAEYQRMLPGADILIPSLTVVVRGLSRKTDAGEMRVETPTFYSTLPGDPILGQYGLDVLGPGDCGLVLAKTTAQRLKVRVGDGVDVVLSRKVGGAEDEHTVGFRVRGIHDRQDVKGHVGYAGVNVINLIHQYESGVAVKEWSLPASSRLSAPDKYAGCLIFLKRDDDLRDEDRRFLEVEKNYRLELLQDLERRTLYGLLKSEALDELVVYLMYSGTSQTDPRSRLSLSRSKLNDLAGSGRKLVAAPVVIPWNEPQPVKVGGKQGLLIGLTLLQEPCWLRRYFLNPKLAFDRDADELSVRLQGEWGGLATESIALTLRDGSKVDLLLQRGTEGDALSSPDGSNTKGGASQAPEKASQADPAPANHDATCGEASEQAPVTETRPAQPPEPDAGRAKGIDETATKGTKEADSQEREKEQTVAQQLRGDEPRDVAKAPAAGQRLSIVPVHFLAHWDAQSHGLADFDEATRRFVPPPEPAKYSTVRVYARTIDDLPELVRELRRSSFGFSPGFAPRVEEIRKQDASLGLLVKIVTLVVFAFGVVTVWIVLLDSTNRKRRDVGILRIMGVSGCAVLYMVMLRAAATGLCATALAAVVGLGACQLLSWEPRAGAIPGDLTWWSEWWWQLVDMKPVASAYLDWRGDWQIAMVALACSLLGSVVPAVAASRLDPFDAVVHAKDS